MKMQNLRMSEVDTRVTAKNGLVALKPIKLNAYDGKVEAAVVVRRKSGHSPGTASVNRYRESRSATCSRTMQARPQLPVA